MNLGCNFPCASSAKNPRSMYARVPQATAQFVLKIEKLSHIMGLSPILEIMAPGITDSLKESFKAHESATVQIR